MGLRELRLVRRSGDSEERTPIGVDVGEPTTGAEAPATYSMEIVHPDSRVEKTFEGEDVQGQIIDRLARQLAATRTLLGEALRRLQEVDSQHLGMWHSIEFERLGALPIDDAPDEDDPESDSMTSQELLESATLVETVDQILSEPLGPSPSTLLTPELTAAGNA